MNKQFLVLLLLLLSFSSFAQGGVTCPEMAPICTDVGLNFTANAGGDEASLLDPGNDYDCLFGQPNPTWYYFQIASDGDIQMELAAAQDIDYAIWGPFTSLSVAQAACGSLGDQSPPNPNNGDIVDCSFSTASTENPVITSAITGEVYVMLITNFAGVVQNITLSQTGGTGSTDCNIVTDPPCAISAFNTTISGCDFTTNHYQISGSVEFTDPPSTGDLVFEDCYGNTTVLASAPFNTTSVNYTIANLLANGDACTVQVYFTDENTCSQSVNYVAPACIGNCPSYSLQSNSPTEACGNQMYWMEIENTGCNGFITFDVVGNFGSLWANEISWSVVSNATGNIVAQGGPGSDGAAINATVGPLDPAVEGNLFTLEIVDSFGDGFNGTGGFIEIQQNGVVLTNSINTFTTSSTLIVQPSVNVSSSTLTVTTPSGVVTNVTSNCLDHDIGFMLNNTNFCTPIAVDLPWTIVCDDTGDLIASGTHVVTVFPQVPSSAGDLVSITWNTTTCSWDISPNNDCSALDIGNIFSITPDVATLGPYCTNGDETFSVSYNGLSGSPDCCSTAGPVLPIEYTENQTVTNAAVASSPFGGINNSAYFVIPANGSGGNATDLAFDFSMTGYCFDPAGTNTDDSYWVTIYVDGVAIYDVQHFDPPGSMNQSFALGDMPNGYNENSIVEVYVYPNNFGLLDGSVMTTYVPNGACPNPGEANWTCASATVSFSTTYEQTSPSAINCDFPLVAPYTCCTTSSISATAPAGVNVECAGDVPAADISSVTNIVSDCPAMVAFVSDASDGNTCPEVITRTYSVTDDCGNTINVIQTITVNDITPPTASNPSGINIECVGDVPAADISVVTDASDNCTALPLVAFVSDASDGNTCPEVITRTYSVTDDCGNSINVIQTITVNDITPPTASNPSGINIECVGDVPAADISVVTDASDNCTALPLVAFVSDASDGNTCPEVITRTYSVTDDCGNTMNVTQTITVNDITPPTASNPSGINIECVGDVPAADISVVTDASDNCTALPLVAFVSDASDGNTCPEVITRTYSVTDDCGNSINVIQTITVNDITPPTASNPSGINIECVGDVPVADISVVTDASDNCTALPLVAFVSDASDGNTCPEVITRTYSVTDDCGNTMNVTQTITVNDITPPTASNPSGINIECVGDVPAADISVVTDASDNCTALPLVAFVSDASDGNTCPEVITRTYSVTDDCGNSINVIQTITVNDITPPTASNPSGINIECVGDVPVADISVVTDASDNCTALPLVAFVSDASDGNTCPEVITRTYSVTDDCGNSINVIQTITVNDITPPTASNPSGINIECVGDVPAADISVVTDASDNCTALPLVAFVSDASDGNTCPEVITRTYSVTDDCGNTMNVTQTITVNDITPPTASNPSGINIECVGDVPAADISVVTDASDNCTALPLVAFVSDASDGNTCPEVITRTYSVTDDCGNSINVIQTITVNDITPPTASNPSGINIECVGDVPVADISVVTDASDNCTALPLVAFVSDASDGNTCPEVITRTYSVTDDCGNSINVIQTITVNDITPPTASNPSGINIECVGDVPAADISVVTDASDNCTVLPVVAFVSDASDGNTCPEVITRTYSVTDDCGNSINVTQTITVNDITPPTASNPPNINIPLAPAPAPDITEVTDAADNCTVAPIVAFVSDQSDGGDCPEVITRTYSVNDDCGNETLVTQSIIIGGGLVPIPTVTSNGPICEGEDVVFTINGLADAVVTYDIGVGPQTITLVGGTAFATVPAATTDITITLSNIADGTCSSFINETATVVVTTPETPTFNQLGPYCQGDSPGAFQGASLEGIVGTWSPNIIDPLLIGATTYTFTPDPGQCASATTMDIEITAPIVPTFTQIDDLCEGAEVFPGGSPFPVASTEGIIGVWAPVFDAFNTTTYTFTPDPAFCATTTTMTINIVGFPVVDAGGDQIITCINNVDGAQTGSPEVTGNTYSWSPTTGLSNPNIANPIANPSTATTYTLTVTNSTGCSSDGTVNVTVDDTPPIVSITNNTGSSTLTCTQLDISVTATGADSYTWDNGLGNIASATITSPGIYTVTGTSLNGCSSTQSIEIIQDNNVDLFVVLSDPEICSGEEVLITANSANATGFDWIVVQNGVSGASAGTISNTPSGAEIIQTLQLAGVNNGSVEYTITPTLGGCIGASQTVIVDVIAPFIPQFDLLGPFCIDETPTSLPLVSNSGITGTWNPTTISTATAGTSTYTFTPNPNQCAISQNIDVTVNDLPVVSFSADNLGGCAPLLVNLTSANGSGTWTISNGVVLEGAQVQLNLLNPGCYDVTLEIQQGGCSNTLTESDFLCVELNPIADFTATPDIFTDQDVLVSFANLSSGASSFFWEFGDENTSTYINPSNLYEYTEEGALITLTAISDFGCTDQAQLIIEYEEQEVFYIPNTFTPDGDNFNQMFTPVFYSGFDPFNFEMLIFNRWGEIVFETRNAEIGWDGTYGLNGMKASDGAYTWKITYKNPKTDQRKVIVGHVTLIR